MKSLLQSEVTRTINSLSKHLSLLSNITSPRGDKQTKIKSNAMTRISNDINKIYLWFFGDINKRPNELNTTKTINKIVNCETGLFLLLIKNLENIEFDAAKKVSHILQYIIKNCQTNKCHHYIKSLTNVDSHNPIIQSLIDQYNGNSSEILHEMVKRPELMLMLLNSKIDYQMEIKMTDRDTEQEEQFDSIGFVDVLIILMQSADLVISSVAFKTLYSLFTINNEYVKSYLQKNFDRFFDEINSIIRFDNCILQKNLLRLLHDIITMENNYDILMKYVQNQKYLISSMNLMMKCSNMSVAFEAWHIFKLFVANKNKEKEIHFILWKNKSNLIKFLSCSFDEKENERFGKERKVIIKNLQNYSN